MFSSFHLHPHDCSAVSKFIVTPTPTSHSPAKHVHINTKSYSQLKPCCDLNIHTSSRQDNLNQILNNFIKMNKL